ncbi:MAG TPA: hypothetical protein VIU61_19310 [Kofleriaceae bacterium]
MTRLCVLLALLAGCDLYFGGGGGDDDICAQGPPTQWVLDPSTGVCAAARVNNCNPCEPCPEPAVGFDWASCPGPCDSLAEGACLDTPLCRAGYTDNDEFAACWSIAPSGPDPGSCAGLDAYECSRHDNCAAYFTGLGGPSPQFRECRPEPSSLCDGITCQVGSRCEEQCYPCEGEGCPPICQAYCVPDTDTCDAIECPAGYDCVQVCKDDPTNPGCGECHVECVATTSCEALATEAQCTARGDCTPVYLGEDCTCDENGHCVCEILEYERCQGN